jgi:hypothetical protein
MKIYDYKRESTIILGCIILILTFCCCSWFLKSILNKIELFSNGDSKRDIMKKIYKSDKICDPDDLDNSNCSKCDNLDGTCDPDS